MNKFYKKSLLPLFCLLILHAIFLINIQYTAWPEMILWPYLAINGWLPYQSIAIAHTPLMLVDLSIFYWLFGVSVENLQIFTYLLILLIDVALFFIVKKLWNKRTALISVFVFSIWQVFFQGNGLWFDLYMGALALLSFYFVKKKDWFWAGVFWGAAFLSKQTAFWFLGPITLALIKEDFFERVKKFTVGLLIVFVPTVFILKYFGILQDFIYWAFQFGITELPRSEGQILFPTLRQLAISLFPFVIFLPLISKKPEKVSLALWAFAGILGAYPRFEYFHFQPALPFLAIAAGLVFSNLKKKETLKFIFLVAYILISARMVYGFVGRNWGKETRFFDETVKEVSDVVRNETEKGEKIYVLNYWDSLYAFTDTVPAVDPWVPHLPWYMQIPGIQEEMVAELEEVSPEIIVAGTYSEVGLSSYRPKLVNDYIDDNYEIVDTVNGVNILKRR